MLIVLALVVIIITIIFIITISQEKEILVITNGIKHLNFKFMKKLMVVEVRLTVVVITTLEEI